MRYEWVNPSKGEFGRFHVTGEYIELEPFSRIVHVERMFLPDPTPTTTSRPASNQTATAH